MFNRILIGIVLIALFFPLTLAFAQEEGTGQWDDYFDWAWKGNFRPFLEGDYGYGLPKHKTFGGDFANLGFGEAKLGYSEIKQFQKFIYSLDDRFLFGSTASTDLNVIDNEEEHAGKVQAKMQRFGFGNRMGFGYKIGPFNLLPYHQLGFIWTKTQTERPLDLAPEDTTILNRYEDNFRFGQTYEPGIKLGLFKSLAFTGSYEMTVVFPRHLFWEWLGSVCIQDAGIALITIFSEEIVNTSPVLGPLMYFLLKNGLSYAFYVAMQENMNWPFGSETPLTVEAFKLGVSLTF